VIPVYLQGRLLLHASVRSELLELVIDLEKRIKAKKNYLKENL